MADRLNERKKAAGRRSSLGKSAGLEKRVRESEKRKKRNSPKAVEAVVASVDLDGDGAGVGLCHAPVALHHDELGPDFVVDLVPFIQHLLDVVLFLWNHQTITIRSRGGNERVDTRCRF